MNKPVEAAVASEGKGIEQGSMTGAQALVRMLLEYEVKVVFGVPGDTSLAFYEAIYDAGDRLQHVLARDERSATFMADAYARLAHRPGFCECPSGAGALYSVPGIAEANASSIPVVLFTSGISLAGEGKGTITEMPHHTLFEPITKHSSVVNSAGVPYPWQRARHRRTGLAPARRGKAGDRRRGRRQPLAGQWRSDRAGSAAGRAGGDHHLRAGNHAGRAPAGAGRGRRQRFPPACASGRRRGGRAAVHRLARWDRCPLPSPSVVISDAGTPTPYITRFLRLAGDGSRVLIPRSFGGLGYAIPAVVGAWHARPDARPVALFGDGSLGMSTGELETLARLNVPEVLIHFNNGCFGWIKTLQSLHSKSKFMSVDFTPGDMSKVAAAYGIAAWRVATPAQLERALDEAFAHDGSCFLDLVTEPLVNEIPPAYSWLEAAGKDPLRS
jgi:thiamine pyrophosphate-dependent acetolactate synthase large subunit-like protein